MTTKHKGAPPVIRMWCDIAAWHPRAKPRVLVAVFRYQATDKAGKQDSDWAVERERTTSDLEVQLLGNEPLAMAGGAPPSNYRDQVREVFSVTCPACEKWAALNKSSVATYEYRSHTLYGALDALRRAGQFDVTVTQLAGIVQNLAHLKRA